MNKKLDPELRARLRSYQERKSEYEAVSPESRAEERTELIVEFTGDLEELKAAGFEPRTVIEHPDEGYKIATGSVPVSQLEDLAAIEHVVDMEGPRRHQPLLDYSLEEVRAVAVHNGDPARKGSGVVIGVIDSGIDWRHGVFINPGDQTSRLLGIWDQMLTAKAGETNGPGGLGVVYTQADLNNGLNGTANIRTLDKDARGKTSGHGTHVAGIAAGNGKPASCCTGGETYVGVAPLAEIIGVRYDYSQTEELGANIRLLDGLDFIFNHPEATGKPIVINISQGDNLGPHDGTTQVERGIDALIAGGAGRAIVVAAGNFAETRCHVKGSVPGNDDLEVEFNVREGHEYSAYLDLWYERAKRLHIEVIAKGGTTSGTVNHGTDDDFIANPTAANKRQSRVFIDGTINGAHGRDNNFRIRIRKPQKGNVPHGDWKLKLTNPDADPVSFHCWIERGEKAPVFLKEKDPPDGKVRSSSDSTLSIPSTARGAITVANHASRTAFCDCWPSTDIVDSSSRGPVARNAVTNPKPDIAAPGLLIASAKADAANLPGNCWACCPDACCCLYEDMTGTSMAAPHVAGAIALMLEEDPTLTKAQILDHLQNSARPRPAGGAAETWGAGKLDVGAALAEMRGNGGGGGGSGGGGGLAPTPFMPTFGNELNGRFTSTAAICQNAREPGSVQSMDYFSPAIRILRARMEGLPEGEYIAAALSRHFSEIRRLINTQRKVATMWHRSEGPLMLRRLLKGAVDDQASPALLSDRQRGYFERFIDQLSRFGSERLRKDILSYKSSVIGLLETPLAELAAAKSGE